MDVWTWVQTALLALLTGGGVVQFFKFLESCGRSRLAAERALRNDLRLEIARCQEERDEDHKEWEALRAEYKAEIASLRQEVETWEKKSDAREHEVQQLHAELRKLQMSMWARYVPIKAEEEK
jgi:peptidoglycan hydrolase CwlO-like protein